MQIPRRLLHAGAPPPETMAVDSDVVVVLASLLCALICMIGLALVARCAWVRRSGAAPPILQKKGVKKKVLRSLPRLSFRSGLTDPKFADCAICLAEFTDGDEIRVLPQCGHGFHVACVDIWLVSNSSCPSCRQILAAPLAWCEKCGGTAATEPTPAAEPVPSEPVPAEPAPAEPAPLEFRASCSKAREDGDGHRFLP